MQTMAADVVSTLSRLNVNRNSQIHKYPSDPAVFPPILILPNVPGNVTTMYYLILVYTIIFYSLFNTR